MRKIKQLYVQHLKGQVLTKNNMKTSQDSHYMSDVIVHDCQNIGKDAAWDAPVRAVRQVECHHFAVAVNVCIKLGAKGVSNFQNGNATLWKCG